MDLPPPLLRCPWREAAAGQVTVHGQARVVPPEGGGLAGSLVQGKVGCWKEEKKIIDLNDLS